MRESDLNATLSIKYVSEGVGQVTADANTVAAAQARVEAAFQALGTSTETTAKKQTSAAAAFQTLSRSMDPAARAMLDLEKTQGTLFRAFSQNVQILDRAGNGLDFYVAKLNTARAAAEALRRQQSNLTTDAAAVTGTIKGTPLSLNQITGSQLSNVNVKDYAAQFEAAAKAQDDMVAASMRLKAALNPLAAEEAKQVQELGLLKQAQQAGSITSEQFAGAQRLSATRLANLSQSLKTAGTAGRVMSGEMTNLGFQLNDIVTGLALGQSPFMIIAQQGGQVLQIFANSKASIADFASSTIKWLGSLVTPASLAIGTLAGFATVGLTAAANWASGQHDIERALVGIGRQSGITATEINEIGVSSSKTTKLSIGGATELATAYAAIGGVAKESIGPAVAATDGLAKALGVDATDAAALLGHALADPAKGLEELQAKTGAFNASSKEMIATAMRNGDLLTAQALITNRVVVATQSAIRANESWTDSFKDVWKWLKDTNNAIGEMAVRGGQLISHDFGGAAPSLGVSKQEQIDTTQNDLNRLQAVGPAVGAIPEFDSTAIKVYNEQVAILTQRLKQLKEDKLGAEIASWNSALDRAANAADKATNAFIPQIDQLHKLEEAEKALTLARNVDLGKSGTTRPDQDAALVVVQNIKQATQEAKAESERYNQQVQQISQSWGGVSQSTAMTLQGLQNQLPVVEAVTEAARMEAQYRATIASLVDKGTKAEEAQLIAAKQLEQSHAAASASVLKQVESLEDSTKMIQAQQDGTEAATAAAIAYKNAIESGASATAAAALSSATLANYMARAATAAQQMAEAASAAATAAYTAAGGNFGQAGGYSSGDSTVKAGTQYTSTSNAGFQMALGAMNFPVQSTTDLINASLKNGVDAAIKAAQSQTGTTTSTLGGGIGSNVLTTFNPVNTDAQISNVDQLYQLKNAQTTDKTMQASNLQAEIGWLKTLPQTLIRDQKIVSLQQSIDQLTSSTDGLNKTMQDALSPYYTQDPRTSHIGFRSQGMALGGEFTVPGGYSSNDNMIASIPVASGEIVAVRRPGQTGASPSQGISVTNHITISGNANKDEVGRTFFHLGQTMRKQLQASSQ